MKMIISLIFYFVVSSLTIFKIGESSGNYGSLMKKVYDESRKSGVIIATTNYISFEEMTALQMMLREMSANGIGSVVVRFTQLEKTVKFHHRQSARLLIVIFNDKMIEMQEFKEGIVNIDMSHSMWLVLFTGDEHEYNCGYCRHLIGNPFNTGMLISCYNSSSLTKWSMKETNYSSTSSPDRAIEKFSGIGGHFNRTLFSSHSFPINREFRIVIPKGCDFWTSGTQLYGYLGEIVMELSIVMNFSISHVSENPRWSGAIETVARHEADIGLAPFDMSPNRLRVVDFSLPLMRGEYTLFIGLSVHSSIQWNGFLKVFHSRIWMVIVILLVITPILLIIIEYEKNCNLYDRISLCYLNVWGLFCQQSWSSPPLKKSSRIIFLSLFISTLVINASYSAVLIRHLATAPVYVKFHSIKEFVNDGTYKVISIRSSPIHKWIQESNDTLVEELRTMMKPSDFLPTTDIEGLEQLCNGRVAFIGETTEENFHQERPPCRYLSFEVGGNINMGIIFPLNSEYTGLANYHIQRFQENGMLNRLKRKYFVKSDTIAQDYEPVSFEDIIPALTIFAIGSFIALIILNCEKR